MIPTGTATWIWTALLLIAPVALAAAEPLPLFEDDEGDASPGSAHPGLPAVAGEAFAYADLLGAEAEPTTDGLRVRLHLAGLPAILPPDTVWAAGWSVDGRHVGIGWVNVAFPFPPFTAEGAYACRFEGEEPMGEQECEPIPGKRDGDAFLFEVPARYLGDGLLTDVGGAVVHVPDATVFPLFLVHFTGATVLDVAEGKDFDARVPPGAENAEGLAVASADPPREAPGPGSLLLAAAGLVGAVALRRRR